MESEAFLIIEKGTPYEPGTILTLQSEKNVIGRCTASTAPEISFTNLLISRRHCTIEFGGGEWTLSDLGSRHGTVINDNQVDPDGLVKLQDGDNISLADGVVVFRFVLSQVSEKTLDRSTANPQLQTTHDISLSSPILIDIDKMRLLIDGEEVCLSAKEWQLLAVFYQNRNKVVSYDKIRSEVWPERVVEEALLDVSAEEVNILIYRLRRKLGNHSSLLKTLRGRGCILEL